jgi:sulfite reductase alpha subunit-like flavoprotein
LEGQLDRETTTQTFEIELKLPRSKIHIFYCGTSGTAFDLAERLRKLMMKKSSKSMGEFGALNSFDAQRMQPNDTILLIVATAGEMPSNGQQFIKRSLDHQFVLPSLGFSIFGIGDSGYHQTSNAASLFTTSSKRENSCHSFSVVWSKAMLRLKILLG